MDAAARAQPTRSESIMYRCATMSIKTVPVFETKSSWMSITARRVWIALLVFCSGLSTVQDGLAQSSRQAQRGGDTQTRPEDRSSYAGKPRVALVIGNGRYSFGALENPGNDARLISSALRDAKFVVTTVEDGTFDQMKTAIAQFGQQIQAGAVGAFYFAGHGVQIQGENYLIPIDTKMQREAEVKSRSINMSEIIERMASAKNPLNLIFLDACRNNPFPASVRGQTNGLARVDAAFGTLISFATAPGQFAEEGEGKNSPYTQHLAQAIRTPGLRLEDVLKRVRAAVKRETKNRQITWDASSIVGDFYFQGEAATGLGAVVLEQNLLDPIGGIPDPGATRNSGTQGQIDAAAEFAKEMAPLQVGSLRQGMQFSISATRIVSSEGVANTDLKPYADTSKKPIDIAELQNSRLTYEGHESLKDGSNDKTLFIFSNNGRQYEFLVSQPYEALKDQSYTKVLKNFHNVEESERAKKLLVGKTLYVLTRTWQSYSERGPGPKVANAQRYVPVVVDDVRRGGGFSGTGWIVFRDGTGQKAVIPAILESGAKPGEWGFGDYFQGKFSFVNPKDLHPRISAKRWGLIENGEIELGMFAEEVRLSLGRPTVLRKTLNSDQAETQVWKIGRQTLTLTDGTLTTISQN
jgi:hypothetical protein